MQITAQKKYSNWIVEPQRCCGQPFGKFWFLLGSQAASDIGSFLVEAAMLPPAQKRKTSRLPAWHGEKAACSVASAWVDKEGQHVPIRDPSTLLKLLTASNYAFIAVGGGWSTSAWPTKTDGQNTTSHMFPLSTVEPLPLCFEMSTCSNNQPKHQ